MDGILPERIENGKIDVNYYQATPFDGCDDPVDPYDNDRRDAGTAVVISLESNKQARGTITTYGCPVVPSTSHPRFEQLRDLGCEFVTVAGHGLLTPQSVLLLMEVLWH